MDLTVWTVLDIFLAVILIICVVVGLKRGLMSMLVRVVGYILSAVGSFYLSRALAPVLYEKILESKLIDTVTEKLEGVTSYETLQESLSSGSLKGVFGLGSVDINDILSKFSSTGTITPSGAAQVIVDDALKNTAISAISIIVFILLFIIFLFICRILSRSLKSVNSVPVIGGLNRVLGAVLGIAEGIIICMLICMVMGYVLGTLKDQTILEQAKSETILFNFMYTYNPFVKLFQS
ncbi:MAG: CvpA family protein [Oscillospiraceae bacterium]|jgi:uncharacterized membrane protein required for colicin V production